MLLEGAAFLAGREEAVTRSDRVPTSSNGFAFNEIVHLKCLATRDQVSVTNFYKEVGEMCLDSVGLTVPVSLAGCHCRLIQPHSAEYIQLSLNSFCPKHFEVNEVGRSPELYLAICLGLHLSVYGNAHL